MGYTGPDGVLHNSHSDMLEAYLYYWVTTGGSHSGSLAREVSDGVCRYVDTVWINNWMPASGIDPHEIMSRLRRIYDDLDEAIADKLKGLYDWGTSPDSDIPHDVPESRPIQSCSTSTTWRWSYVRLPSETDRRRRLDRTASPLTCNAYNWR